MKKIKEKNSRINRIIKIYIILTILTIVRINAQSTWTLIPSGVNRDLLGIDFANDSIGYIVSDEGVYLKTIDGGFTWDSLNTNFPDYSKYYDIITLDNVGNKIIAVRYEWYGAFTSGIISTSINGGATWSHDSIQSPWTDFKDIDFIDSTNGFAVGFSNFDNCLIYSTTDGGTNWTIPNGCWNAETFQDPISVFMVSNTIVYMTCQQGIFKSSDGGVNWINTHSFPLPFKPFQVFFPTSNIGYAVGPPSGLILKTVNAALSWDTISYNIYPSTNSIFFTSTDSGYVVGGLSTLISTVDGGNNWNSETIPPGGNGDYRKVYFTEGGIGFVIGNNGIILKKSINTSIPEINNSSNLIIEMYPNPTNDLLNIYFGRLKSSKVQIKILDILGKFVYETNFKMITNLAVDISKLERGIYLIYIRTDKEIIVRKLIKE